MTAYWISSRRFRTAAACTLLVPLLLPTTPAETTTEPPPCEVRDEIRALRDSVQELVEVLRLQSEQSQTEGLVNQILALDQGIVTLDSALREVSRERAEVYEELIALRGQYGASTKTVDDSTTNDTVRESLRGFLSNQAEKIAVHEERLASLDARASELRDTIRKRQLQRQQLETRLDRSATDE